MGWGRVMVAGAALLACSDQPVAPAATSAAPPWASGEGPPAPKLGMVWIPAGTFSAGTPRDQVPRVPDAEMAGEAVALGGFYIDRFPHPNEAGAIPTTNVTLEAAKALCAAEEKRLCTELELERACKGPSETRYPYGDAYDPDACATGGRYVISPNGLHTACKSAFGVHDTHGSVWVWTASPWGRGTEGFVALRGGGGDHGELLGRCAHADKQRPDERRADIGVRCCAGPENLAKVVLDVERGPALKLRVADEELTARLTEAVRALPSLAEGAADAAGSGASDAGAGRQTRFVVERAWAWRPTGNEQLFLGGGCAAGAGGKVCGVLVGRARGERQLTPLAFVLTDEWQPTISEGAAALDVFIHGGDQNGAFRKRVSYDWGRVAIGEKQRKKRPKRGKPRYE